MEQTVYLDLLFLINFSMDFLCFYIASRIISVKFPTLRALFASFIGGAYADAALFLPAETYVALAIDIAVCFVMCLIVYGRKHGIIFSTLVYFSVSMALGGFMTAIFNLLNRMGFNEASVEETDSDGISVWLFALLAALSAVLTLLGGRFFRKRSSVRSVGLEFEYNGKKTCLDALVDSGNLLREPMSGRACVVVDTESAKDIFPQEIIKLAAAGDLMRLEDAAEHMKNIRLVPARTAAGDGMLIGVRAERVRIDSGRGMYEVDAMIVLSAIGEGGAHALVPSELVK